MNYDILIAGAGPAGCAAAYDLAHAGKRVLLLDKRTFPRPKACACGLTRKTLTALRYSVDPIVERVCHEIVLQQTSEDPKHREVRVRTRNPICAMAVRERFDDFCLHQTLASGRNGGSVELHKIDSILALRELPTRIELDITFTESGEQHTETLTTPILIGADGSNGQTRRLTTALKDEASTPEGKPSEPPWYTRGFALEATIPYATLPSTLPAGDTPTDLVFDFAPLPGGYGWLFPKGDHINIGVGAFAPQSNPTTTPGAPGSNFGPRVSTEANLKSVTRQLLAAYTLAKLGVALPKEVTGQYLGMGGHAYIPQSRVLLTGDAAGLVDPLTGEGIHSAIVSGQAAAAAILETFASLFATPEANLLHPTAAAYARHLQPLQETLAFSHRAAHAFYATPERGFRVMRTPILRSLVLKTYADGLPHTGLLTRLAKVIA
jgi:geranylgeranyl reductase family protein